jgi:hypothetical protein
LEILWLSLHPLEILWLSLHPWEIFQIYRRKAMKINSSYFNTSYEWKRRHDSSAEPCLVLFWYALRSLYRAYIISVLHAKLCGYLIYKTSSENVTEPADERNKTLCTVGIIHLSPQKKKSVVRSF